MSKYLPIKIDLQFLEDYKNSVYIFSESAQRDGDNLFRNNPRTIGLITRKSDIMDVTSSFKIKEYSKIFFSQLNQIEVAIRNNPNDTFYIEEMIDPITNKNRIWERLIKHNIEMTIGDCKNVTFCWEETFVSKYPLLTIKNEH